MNKNISAVLFKQQFRSRLSSMMMWVVLWSLLLLLFATVFNSLSKDAAVSSKIFKQLPSGIFNSFNIDPSSYLSHIESFISGQFLSVYLLAGSIFAFSLGVNSIGKRIESRVIAMYLTKPISRNRFYAVQSFVNVTYFFVVSSVLCVISLVIFNNLLKNQNNVSTSYFTALFLGSGLLFVVLTVLGQLVGVVLNGGKAVIAGAGIVVVSWFLNSLAPLAHLPSWVQNLSLFHYFNVSLLRTDYKLAVNLTVQLVIIGLVLFIIGRRVFKHKDLYI